MRFSLGAGPGHVVFFSRSCLCHPHQNDDGALPRSGGVMEYIRWRKDNAGKHARKPCSGKGLVAGEFAVGRGRRIIREASAKLGHLLIVEFWILGRYRLDRSMCLTCEDVATSVGCHCQVRQQQIVTTAFAADKWYFQQ